MILRKSASAVLLPLLAVSSLFLAIQPAAAVVPAAPAEHLFAGSASPDGIGDWLHEGYCRITRSC